MKSGFGVVLLGLLIIIGLILALEFQVFDRGIPMGGADGPPPEEARSYYPS